MKLILVHFQEFRNSGGFTRRNYSVSRKPITGLHHYVGNKIIERHKTAFRKSQHWRSNKIYQ